MQQASPCVLQCWYWYYYGSTLICLLSAVLRCLAIHPDTINAAVYCATPRWQREKDIRAESIQTRSKKAKRAKKCECILGKTEGTSKHTSVPCVEEVNCQTTKHEGHPGEAVQEASALLSDCVRHRSSVQGKASWRAKNRLTNISICFYLYLYYSCSTDCGSTIADSSKQERRAQRP